MQSVTNRPDVGYRVVWFVDRRNAQCTPDFGRFHRVAHLTDLAEIIDREMIDEVVLALPGSAHEEAWDIIRLCTGADVGLKLVPDMFQVSLSQARIDNIAGIPLLDVQDAPFRRLERGAKRGLDILVGSFIAVIRLPVLGILALLVKLESPGPVYVR